jgi:hypothetical protein
MRAGLAELAASKPSVASACPGSPARLCRRRRLDGGAPLCGHRRPAGLLRAATAAAAAARRRRRQAAVRPRGAQAPARPAAPLGSALCNVGWPAAPCLQSRLQLCLQPSWQRRLACGREAERGRLRRTLDSTVHWVGDVAALLGRSVGHSYGGRESGMRSPLLARRGTVRHHACIPSHPCMRHASGCQARLSFSTRLLMLSAEPPPCLRSLHLEGKGAGRSYTGVLQTLNLAM